MSLDSLHHITFADPWFLWLLILIPALIYGLIIRKNKNQASLRLSSLEGLEKVPVSWKVRFRPVMQVLRLLAITLLIISLARPRLSNTTEDINSNGIDIVICLDISGSMLAEDFQPNRIEAAKQVAMHFVDERPSDRIGLVIFAGESFTQCPITTDHAVLKDQISKVNSGMLEDGTAIGMGLGTSVDRLRQSKAKSKVIILMTDGVNNTGLVDPLTALEIAKAYGVKVYTIGIGTNGVAPYPVPLPNGGTQLQNMQVQIDEPLLKKIASETGGLYFRATGNTSLDKIYQSINKLEKSKVKITSYKRYQDLFFPLALVALVLIFLEVGLRYTVFKSLP